MQLFHDRIDAGQRLAEKLQSYKNNPGVIIFALPRGGVPVGYEIARALQVPLDVFLVRKLGVPGQDELAMGAIAMGGETLFNQSIIENLHVSQHEIDECIQAETAELNRRNDKYRQGRPLPDLNDKIVLLVDDGIATGATIRVAAHAIKLLQPKKLVVVAPVAAEATLELIAQEVDEVVCLFSPAEFYSISVWYRDFPQTSDEEVLRLLELI